MVVCDCWYVDNAMLYKWKLSGIDFVISLKSNATCAISEYELKQFLITSREIKSFICTVHAKNIRSNCEM